MKKPAPLTTNKSPRTRVILLVDADGDVETLVEQAAAMTGHCVVGVNSSAAAFAILAERIRNFNLIILDVDPGAHGLALLEAVGSCAEKPPILVLTALERAYATPIALEHGAAACLAKPVPLAKLVATLQQISKPVQTSDRWGNLVPPHNPTDLHRTERFRGIADKLAPHPEKGLYEN